MFALPIFTASHPATIVGADVLNFCVRDGNRWTHIAINTNSFRMAFAICYIKADNRSNSKLNYSTLKGACQHFFKW